MSKSKTKRSSGQQSLDLHGPSLRQQIPKTVRLQCRELLTQMLIHVLRKRREGETHDERKDYI